MEYMIFFLLASSTGALVIGSIFYYLLRLSSSSSKQCHHIAPAPDCFDLHSEIVVVGSGVLGSAIGAVLARDGRKVAIIERDLSEPDRIVGELLQPGGLKALQKLGLADAVADIDAHTVKGYVIHDRKSGSHVQLSYPLDENNQVQTGRSFHHGRFIMGLRRQCQKESNVTMIEGTVVSLLETNGTIVGVEYKEKSSNAKKYMSAALTIVADGCFSKFRKDLTKSSVSVKSNFAGLIMHNVPQMATGHAEIVLGHTGPILIYQISSTCTRILVDVPTNLSSEIKEYMLNTIAPQLPEYVYGPFVEAIGKDRVRSMPNSFLPAIPLSKTGAVILGDAFNMRHPLTGAGMSVALNDALVLKEILNNIPDLTDRKKVLAGLKQLYWKRKANHSFVINVLAQALYALFASSEGYVSDLRQACFEYFKLGGMAVSGPVGLISVLRPNPAILIGHFFAVALYAMYRTASENFRHKPHLALFRPLLIFGHACHILFPLLSSELQFHIRL